MSATRIFSTLSGLLDVSVSGVTSGQFLQWNGSAWVAASVDLSGYVPTSRTVNGQALSSDITVAAAAGTLTGSTLASGVTASSLTSVGTLTGLAVASGTITVSTPQTLTQTWNASGVTFTAFRVNVTNTASAAASMLLDLQIGGVSQFKVTRFGEVTAANYVNAVQFQANNFFSLVGPVYMYCDAANVFAQRNGTSAQSLRVYNTFTSSTNYERGAIRWSSNVMRVGTSKGSGGGTARDIVFETDETTRLTIDSLGRIIPVLPTSSAGLPTGALWNDAGIVKVA